MVMDSNIQDQQEHKRARQPPECEFCALSKVVTFTQQASVPTVAR